MGKSDNTLLGGATALFGIQGLVLGSEILNLRDQHRMTEAQKKLDNQQKEELNNERAARDAEAGKAAVSGQNFGGGPLNTVATGLGYNTAPRASANTGRGQIVGAF